MRHLFTAFAATALLPVASMAQEPAQHEVQAESPLDQRATDVVAAMRGDLPYTDVFAPAFTSAIAEAQFLAIQGQLEAQFGALIGLESIEASSATMGTITIRFENALVGGPLVIQAEQPFQVTGLQISDIRPIDDSAEGLLADVQALPGESSLLVTRLGTEEPILAHNADAQMALGSTFKLYVLSALAHSIAAGERSWDDVVPLTERSFPSGQLQNWPEGSPVTLHTLATLMISISDNTATDQLIRELGREAVEAEVIASGHSDPVAMLPFMTTRELFVLKSGDAAEVETYRTLDSDGRRAALDALAEIEREESQLMAAFSGGPNAIDIEWFASGEDIARLFTRLRDLGDETALGVMGVNPSLSEGAEGEWAYVGYKGGSEPGVLNLSWLLQDEAGDWFVVTMGWNNPEANLDLSQFELLARRAIVLAGE